MRYNDILKIAAMVAVEERKGSLLVSCMSYMEVDVVEYLEKELNPEYMNDVFTWAQVKKALEKQHSKLINKNK